MKVPFFTGGIIMKKDTSKKSVNERILSDLPSTISSLTQEVSKINIQLAHLFQQSKKIDEIYSLHFPNGELEKNAKLRDRFLAEIILGIPRKRKKG
ncbi:hypothetical protein DU508_15345 [Pedobacter chinensis]|uniref:Uncharacterized protein n=1 Tax=Pedobacter chinensis TaxID=2282421 RepID=A0A369PY89_9SPHI|nr:hypothetical protein [Pedobacter chinensis]RDC55649.1 hypothetical protein DU508_15345 [Pedobacter chinensis]